MQEFINKTKEVLSNAKYVIATIGVIISSLIGAYELTTEYFVTQSYAAELERHTYKQLQELKSLNQQNTIMILELRLLGYEDKMSKGPLSPTDKRTYDYLKNQLEKIKVLPNMPEG